MDFIHRIIIDNLPRKEVDSFHLVAFTLFMFVLVSDILGLITKIVAGDDLSVWKSPTTDPVVTLALTMMMIILTHFFGMRRFGFKGYLINSYSKPVGFLLPVKLMKEFTNLLTLGLCLYGNISTGGVLLSLITGTVASIGLWAIPLTVPLEMIWVAFSILIECIQTFTFVTFSMAYTSYKIETGE